MGEESYRLQGQVREAGFSAFCSSVWFSRTRWLWKQMHISPGDLNHPLAYSVWSVRHNWDFKKTQEREWWASTPWESKGLQRSSSWNSSYPRLRPPRPQALAPHLLSWPMAVRVTDLSNTSGPREAISLPDNCSFSRGFFLHSLGKNEAHSSTQERPLKPGRGSARRVCPLSPGGARSSAPRRQAGARGALSSPRFVLPTSTGLMKLENGSRVSLGYSLHLERETQRGQHKKASLPVPSLLPQHLCPPTRAKRLLGARWSFLF